MPLTPVLTSRWGADRSWRLSTYERLEGYSALRTALRMAPDELVTMVKDSGLRGRGGAGFPTGMKWSFIPQPKPGETPTGPAAMPKYLVVNADEGEPGTCKDLPLMMVDPHSLIEGVIISAFAIRSHFAVIYVRGEAVHAHRRLMAAVEEAYAAGYLGSDILGSGYDLELVVHAGAGVRPEHADQARAAEGPARRRQAGHRAQGCRRPQAGRRHPARGTDACRRQVVNGRQASGRRRARGHRAEGSREEGRSD